MSEVSIFAVELDRLIHQDATKWFVPILSRRPSDLSVGLMIYLLMDIYKYTRKFIFFEAENVIKEFDYLIDRTKYPTHYPQYFACLADECYPNPAYLSLESIQKLHSIPVSLVSLGIKSEGDNSAMRNQKENTFYVVSDNLFSCFEKIDNFDSFCHFVNLFTKCGIQSQKKSISVLESMFYYKIDTKLSQPHSVCPSDITCSLFPRFIPTAGKKKVIISTGKVYGEFRNYCYMDLATTEKPEITTDIKMDKLVINRISKVNFTYLLNTAFYKKESIGNLRVYFTYDINEKSDQGSKRFIFRSSIPPGYIVEHDTYLNHPYSIESKDPVVLPVECLDIENLRFEASNFLHTLIPDYQTQKFIWSFDGSQLLDILNAIPNFDYKFSSQQKEVIMTGSDCMVVGRSGTGKTTCALMRMVAIRLLEIAKKNRMKGIKRIRYEDICEGMFRVTHSVFCKDGLHHGVSTPREVCKQDVRSSDELSEGLATPQTKAKRKERRARKRRRRR